MIPPDYDNCKEHLRTYLKPVTITRPVLYELTSECQHLIIKAYSK